MSPTLYFSNSLSLILGLKFIYLLAALWRSGIIRGKRLNKQNMVFYGEHIIFLPWQLTCYVKQLITHLCNIILCFTSMVGYTPNNILCFTFILGFYFIFLIALGYGNV